MPNEIKYRNYQLDDEAREALRARLDRSRRLRAIYRRRVKEGQQRLLLIGERALRRVGSPSA